MLFRSKTHEEVRAHVLDYFLGKQKKRKFKRIPGQFNYKDIQEIVDILYVDPHDLLPVLGGKRISKLYYDAFMEMMNNASMMQAKCSKASFMLNKLIILLPHL